MREHPAFWGFRTPYKIRGLSRCELYGPLRTFEKMALSWAPTTYITLIRSRQGGPHHLENGAQHVASLLHGVAGTMPETPENGGFRCNMLATSESRDATQARHLSH
ncbi:hypothetical protein [Rhizorhabdus wittichii]|uniref:hypothetical protein n=1 Tax=Rhizorhabdus wittichii TaxID=160791 RepID=UPI0012FDDB96|nr:hypothetical protein [Rhizorhabdus wittichii]